MAERARGQQRTSTVGSPVIRASAGPGGRGVGALCALLGLLPVTPVLAPAYGLAPFAAIGVATARRPRLGRLHRALVVGTVGGVIGTLGDDLVRVPLRDPAQRRPGAVHPARRRRVALDGALR
ncbi:hypothetical protein [Kitasatospora sp. NPDC058190]|uniref:hypothetical protein n=1 Tax=Kitasatospora sp. NPDC058190 TaxID=3346371 RepID=UPI0036DAFED6